MNIKFHKTLEVYRCSWKVVSKTTEEESVLSSENQEVINFEEAMELEKKFFNQIKRCDALSIYNKKTIALIEFKMLKNFLNFDKEFKLKKAKEISEQLIKSWESLNYLSWANHFGSVIFICAISSDWDENHSKNRQKLEEFKEMININLEEEKLKNKIEIYTSNTFRYKKFSLKFEL
ncbi:hypothetical protein [Spiroplasma endosymbiont of Cantharis rufa]|uniref:hypothetical protein n=1 Tax=Spiroplasma endosymbiont of Cantharis rufa TaxID=3066279 RepID=UPI0030D5F048